MKYKEKGLSTLDGYKYPVRPDEQGNCQLTGIMDSGGYKWNKFTVEELEVFTVKSVQ